MKTKLLLSFPLSFILLVMIYGFGGDAKYPGGSPGGYTGSPGDGKNCTQCHGGSATQVVGWITSDIPLDGYIPGETYNIYVTVTGSGKKGFEVSPQNLSGNLLGTLIDAPNVHLVSGNKAVTQDNTTSANPAQWQFQWTAPEAGTGDVTFYGAFALNESNTKLSTYTTQENTGVFIDEPQLMEAVVYPNPAHENIHISYTAVEAGKTMISLVSMDGRSFNIYDNPQGTKGTNSITCNIPGHLKAGVYVICVQQNQQISHTKLLLK